MADAPNFAKLVPGFDFLQGLVKNASATLPNIGQWVAPTLNPEELERRIGELRTVQFWLEQNAKMLGATIQALEVQRMTLSTLKTMNVQMEDLRDSLQIRLPGAAAGGKADGTVAASTTARAASPAPATARPGSAARPAEAAASASTGATPPAAIDPMQWWSALTKQFTQLAADAMKETTSDAAKGLAGAAAERPAGGAGPTSTASSASAPAPSPSSRPEPARKAAPRKATSSRRKG